MSGLRFQNGKVDTGPTCDGPSRNCVNVDCGQATMEGDLPESKEWDVHSSCLIGVNPEISETTPNSHRSLRPCSMESLIR